MIKLNTLDLTMGGEGEGEGSELKLGGLWFTRRQLPRTKKYDYTSILNLGPN